ncbi:MAG: tetratricopeptide repeat protein [Gemmatimonadales bacterium]
MTLDKLKVAARQHEQRDEWRAAIDLYRQAIHKAEQEDGGADPSLYNRIGDLEQREGDDHAACEAWEQAAARYGEQGFFNNAIALCGKILRLDPARVRTYLDLARFQARKRVIYDVRQNLEAYLQHMSHRGESDAAARELEKLAAEFGAWKELGRTVNELLGRDTADAEADGGPDADGRGGLVFLDTDRARAQAAAELVVEPTAAEPLSSDDGVTIDGIERASAEVVGDADEPVGDVAGLINFERTSEGSTAGERLDGLESAAIAEELVADAGSETITLDGLEPTEQVAAPEATEMPASPTTTTSDGIVFLDTATVDEAPEAPAATDDAIDIAVPAGSPLEVRAEGHERLELGDRAGAIAALERALAGYLEAERLDRAFQVATELIEAQPASIDRYQARVEIAVRMKTPAQLCLAYLELADALSREGAQEKAVAVYRRVLEIDEGHAEARAALRRMVPDAPSEQTEDGFIDFGAMVNDDVGPRSSRMRTETTTISDDEDETFREALAEFKRALDQNIAVDDHQAHYDLGLAFKEMGLLEEAIGEFQKALRSTEGRLRTSEALGQCFFEQGRPAVAEAVLRSVEKGDEGDAEKIGVLYWLGRALESQGKTKNARTYYERVLAVDVAFHDVSDRITALTDGAG